MNRVKSQRKALVSLLSVLIALMLAYGTIGTKAEGFSNAATFENNPAAVGADMPDNETGDVSEITGSVDNVEIIDVSLTDAEGTSEDGVGAVAEPKSEISMDEGATGEDEIVGLTADEESGVLKEEVQRIRAVFELSEEERQSVPADIPEKVAKLLVTSKEYFDEEVVKGAQSIPLESNDARYEYITGDPYKVYTMSDKPKFYSSEGVASKRMSAFDVPYWIMDSAGNRTATTGKMTINELLADSVKCIFSDIFMLGEQFPINYLVGFMYRKVGGVGLVNSQILSAHSFGVAIDINNGDYDNDLYLGKGNDLRDKSNPFCISDDVIGVFAAYGWNWGGDFDICSDTMHFQYFGLEFLQYENEEPFPVLEPGKSGSATVVENLRSRLHKLGYVKKASGGKYDKALVEAVRAFQADYGLEPDGIVDYETWVPIINLTHDMPYVF